MVLKKIREKLNLEKLLTFSNDKQKHLNGALFANFGIFFSFFFFGQIGAIVAMILAILFSIGWEFTTDKFSFLDIIVFIVGITPVSVLILNN